jgi:hypothetical protein
LDKDEGDRLRRLSAVMRFLSHMRGSADERELMLSLIQAGAVWYDLDARVYRRELNGRFSLEAWLPAADVTNDPREIDVDGVLKPDAPTRISSINDLEQHGWQSVQGEVILLPIAAASLVRRLLAVTGPVEREVEATMTVVCSSAGAVLDQLAQKRGHDVRDRLAQRVAMATSAFGPSLRSVMDEYVGNVEAAAARVVMTRPGLPAVTGYSTGGQVWTGEETVRLAPGAIELSPRRIAIGFALRKDAAGAVELLAPLTRPFTVERAEAASVGADVLAVWLAGLSLGAAQTAAGDLQPAPEAPPFEDAMRKELDKAGRLSLSGGVVVASVPGAEVPDPRVVSVLIRTVRAELRSADLMGQLAGGDVAAVLVRTGSEGVAKAAERIRLRLDELARAHKLPAAVVGHALYPGGVGESPAALVERARREAGLMFS